MFKETKSPAKQFVTFSHDNLSPKVTESEKVKRKAFKKAKIDEAKALLSETSHLESAIPHDPEVEGFLQESIVIEKTNP